MRRPRRRQVRNSLLLYIVSSGELFERNVNSTFWRNTARKILPKRDKTGPKVATKNFAYSVAGERNTIHHNYG